MSETETPTRENANATAMAIIRELSERLDIAEADVIMYCVANTANLFAQQLQGKVVLIMDPSSEQEVSVITPFDEWVQQSEFVFSGEIDEAKEMWNLTYDK